MIYILNLEEIAPHTVFSTKVELSPFDGLVDKYFFGPLASIFVGDKEEIGAGMGDDGYAGSAFTPYLPTRQVEELDKGGLGVG